jgi:hypothetical protein
MSGAGLNDLRRERGRYDFARCRDFGSLRSRLLRDQRMAKELGRRASDVDLVGDRDQVRALANRLGYGERGERAPASRASQVEQGYVRLHVGGATYRLIDRAQQAGENVSFVTLAFRGGAVPPEQIGSINPKAWGKQLKTDLDRARKRTRRTDPGWSIWFLDSDYLHEEGVFLFHWHGFATGNEIAAINALRKTRKYRSPKQKPNEERDLVKRRVRRTHLPITNIGYLCLYVLKERWPSQPSARNQAGNRKRSYSRPLPANLMPVERLFFDRWSVQDISVVRGLRVINGRLTSTV